MRRAAWVVGILAILTGTVLLAVTIASKDDPSVRKRNEDVVKGWALLGGRPEDGWMVAEFYSRLLIGVVPLAFGVGLLIGLLLRAPPDAAGAIGRGQPNAPDPRSGNTGGSSFEQSGSNQPIQ
jgi:hypothetical protein